MNTAEELIQDVKNAFSGMGEDLDALEDFNGLICVLLTAPDVEEYPGLHRLMIVMFDHLRAVRERHGKATKAIQRLANP